MKFEHTEVWGFEHALRGMRNPKESYHLSDSKFAEDGSVTIGPNDMKLAQNLIRGGSVHRKFMRQIFVSVDITAPMYWWSEFDTYKVGTTADSTSKMHTIQKKPITMDRFETDDYIPILSVDGSDDEMSYICNDVDYFVKFLEHLRKKYLETQDKRYWKELIRWLPCGWLQTRTVTMTYENLIAMCSKDQRRFHKLSEWRDSFITWAWLLPYAQELIFLDELDAQQSDQWEVVKAKAIDHHISPESLSVLIDCITPFTATPSKESSSSGKVEEVRK